MPQKSHQILVPRLASVLNKWPKMIGHHHSKWLELYFCLLLVETCSSWTMCCPFWNSDIPASQSALKQQKRLTVRITMTKLKAYTRQPFNFRNILTYFRFTNNKVKATLNVLRTSYWSKQGEISSTQQILVLLFLAMFTSWKMMVSCSNSWH